jgi:ATP-binding cassette, subfamily B, multidrug efflux pump
MLRLFRFLKPYTVPICIVLAMVFLQTLSDLYLPTLMSDIVNQGIMVGDTDYILKTGGRMMIFVGGSVLSAIIASYFSSKAAMGFGRDIRKSLFTKVESFSLNEFDKIGTATLITRTTNDVTQVQNVTIMILRMMVSAPMMAVGGLILALQKDKPLTLVLAVAIPVLVGTIALLATRVMPLFTAMQKKIDRINLVLRENLTGIRVVRAFNRIDHEKLRFEGANEDLTQTYIKVNRIMAFMFPAMMLIMNITTLAILWFGGIRIDEGSMNIGNLIAFMQYAMQIMFSFLMFTMMFIMVPRAQAAAVRINEVLAVDPEIVDPKAPVKSGAAKGLVEFKNVSFRYHGAEQCAICDINFTARPGEVTAIIGGTGSGKSTLVNLIPRFYDVEGGEVLVDGINVKDMTQKELRSKIGFVPQKSILFSGSIAENIRFGKEEATEDEVAEAAATAQATEFITEMEDGYGHTIAEGGTNVSGGQKQRLSIARALAMKPEIYIFDDSFSALDFKTDAKLRAALRKQTDDATVFIISQRVSTVMDSDRIIVMDEGIISGMGTHKELMKTCDVYREIVASQLSEEESA